MKRGSTGGFEGSETLCVTEVNPNGLISLLCALAANRYSGVHSARLPWGTYLCSEPSLLIL